MGEIQGALAAGNGTGAGAVTLLVVRGPQAEGEAVLAALSRLAGPDGGAVLVSVMPDLTAALAQPGNAPVVVLHRSAEFVLTGAMAQGAAPSAALASWMATAASQLAVIRRHRRRITLVEAAVLSGHRATDVLDRLAVRLGLDALLTTGPQAAVPVMPDPLPVMSALARICLADSAEAQALASELDALVLGPSEGPADDHSVGTEALADAAFAAHVMLYEDAGGMRARAENALLLDQLAHMQQQMEQAQAETEVLGRLLHDTRSQATTDQLAVQARLAEAEAQLAEARGAARAGTDPEALAAERDLLLDQLGHMQMQVEQAQAEAVASLRLRDDIQRAAPAVEVVATRALRDGLLGDEILRLGRAERDLQDQLETLTAAAAQHLADRDADLERLRRDLDATGRDLADARRELAAVYASRSWRITGPLRKARLTVTKKDNPDG